MMEISNTYSKVLELEGLLLSLKSENADNYKIERIFSSLFDKIEEINADLADIRRKYTEECVTDGSMIQNSGEAVDMAAIEIPEISHKQESAIAESAVFEETEDADLSVTDAAGNDTDTENAINIIIDETGRDVNRTAFALRTRGDIRKMFTLNDNYKFRRQLFENSQERYTRALAEVVEMKSTHDAEHYFYNILQWDKENADVKEFMAIISAYFLGK